MAVNVGPFIAGVVIFALGIFVLWVLVYASGLVRPKVREEAETVTGATAMERKALLATGMVIAIGVWLTAYGFYDPIRQVNARERQLETSIGRGVETYATLCYGCHGVDGKGAVVPETQPPRVAPQLNRPQFADSYMADPDQAKATYDLVYKTIQRGRPGTPMPAWGQTDGGTLNNEQIYELATMITHGSQTINFRGQRMPVWDAVKEVVEEHIAAGSPTPIPLSAAAPPLPPELQAGRQVFQEKGCVACHATEGDTVLVGPPLTHIATVAETRKPGMSAEEYIRESILNPSAFIVPGFPGPPSPMPVFQGNITDQELDSLLKYLLSLK